MKTKTTDKRPDPKPRRHAHLYQAYQAWSEFQHLRIKHGERLRSIEHGKSMADVSYQSMLIDDCIMPLEKKCEKELLATAKLAGPIYDWLTSIKGIGGHTAAKLIALIDDPANFATISKLWRFAGYAVFDGKREYRQKGKKATYNGRLKSEVYLVTQQFILHATFPYADLYYAEKAALRAQHPAPISDNGTFRYTDRHIDLMARRKVSKVFLQHLWLTWRRLEGLPVSEPYVQAILRHTNIILPPTEQDYPREQC